MVGTHLPLERLKGNRHSASKRWIMHPSQNENQAPMIPLADPERDYGTPMALVGDSMLSLERKIELLDRWEFTVNARLAAGDEGMPVSAAREARDSELIRAIGAARSTLIAN